MSSELEGRVALVTGAAGRIGRAVCLALAESGSKVVASDIDTAGLGETMSLLGGGHRAIEADLRDRKQVRSLIDAAIQQEGRLDILVNNAGVLSGGGSVVDCSDQMLDLTLAVNVVAVFVAIQQTIPHMLSNGGGVIINIGSVFGEVGMPGFSSYSTSKGAVIALTRQVASEYASRGIRCNVINPGTVLLPESEPGSEKWREDLRVRHPAGRIGSPQDVANVVVFLASERSAFMHGASVAVDGGWTAV